MITVGGNFLAEPGLTGPTSAGLISSETREFRSVTWFTFDLQGRQAWFYSVGSVLGNTIAFELLMPSGTDFGPTFDPADMSRPVWGTATFTFDGCNSGSMSYVSQDQAYGSGSLGLIRLTKLSGLPCR